MAISVPTSNKGSLEFRILTLEETAAAYNIVKQSVARLLINQLPAWLMPYNIYEQGQAKGENYGLFLEQQLGAVITLSTSHHPQGWTEYLPETDFIWLGTLCVADQFRGQGKGDIPSCKRKLSYKSKEDVLCGLTVTMEMAFYPPTIRQMAING
jgi:hypothetical protein